MGGARGPLRVGEARGGALSRRVKGWGFEQEKQGMGL